MMDRYGKAVVEERTQPRNLAELRNYLRMEYGLGTEPGHLLREAGVGGKRPQSRITRAFHKVVRTLTRVAGAQAASNGRRPGGGATDPTR